MRPKRQLVSNEYRICHECEEPFVAETALQFLCKDCKPFCKGCKNKFDPINKTSIICTECSIKIANEVCTNCGETDYPSRTGLLNGYGHCADCVSLEERYKVTDDSSNRNWCRICKKVEIESKHTVCRECLTKEDTCTYCAKNKKYVSEYCCTSCEKIFMEEEKTYKLPL